jgi:hypothetical protein
MQFLGFLGFLGVQQYLFCLILGDFFRFELREMEENFGKSMLLCPLPPGIISLTALEHFKV